MNIRKYIALGLLVLVVCTALSFLWLKNKYTVDVDRLDPYTGQPFGAGGTMGEGTTNGGTGGGVGSAGTTTTPASKPPFDIEKIKNMSTKYGEGYAVYSTEQYAITFWEPDSSFTLTLLETPIGWIRKLAEDKLVEILGMQKEEICKLTVIVAAPARVDLNGPYGYGLSFCPGAVVMPALDPNAQ